MILVADSGSTKCDWAIIESKNKIVQFSTMGFNPFFHSEELIISVLSQVEEVKKYKDKIKLVYYYGAGSSTKQLKLILQRALSNVFTNAQNIHSDHDLVGAGLATYDGAPCISCILGTGSNAGYFDGDILKEETPALGYILGDEGSGAYFGKKLLKYYAYKQMPDELYHNFKEKYQLDKPTIIENVYRKPFANVYLASFMRFLSDNASNPFVSEMISEGFFDFLTNHVTCYKNYKEVKVHFVGSVAYYFKDNLKNVCKSLEINIGEIVKSPIEGLTRHHIIKNNVL